MVAGKLPPVPDLLAIDLPAGPEWVDHLLRAWDRGDAVLPIDHRLAAPARAALLDAMRPAAVVTAGGVQARGGARPVEPGDALVVATSGTTGGPKGVVLTAAAVEASARATSARLGVVAGRHRWLACLPLSHVGGLSVVTRAVITGCQLTVLPAFDAGEVMAHASADTMVSLVPTTLRRVRPVAFHTIVLGGSAPPDGLPPNVVTTYGMTETGSGVVYDGLPLDGVDVNVDATTGEIRLRGPMLLRGYRDGTVPLDAGGWLATGDAGWVDDAGRLHVEGRLSELIITGGENVWPAPVEAILRRHPGVADVAVAGVPDAEWGQRVVAFVVPRPSAPAPTLDALRGLVAGELAAFAAPRQLELVERLPTTAIGKVMRGRLVAGG
jgi:O-succinylbenzoic acid--CoA ligase